MKSEKLAAALLYTNCSQTVAVANFSLPTYHF